jgi:hypothetical protein
MFVFESMMKSLPKEHPRGLKRKRQNFMREDPPSWTRGCHRQNGAHGGGKVHNDKRTHVREGATESGPEGPGPVSPGRPTWPTLGSVRPPISWAWRCFNPKYVEAPPFSERERERAIRPRGRSQARERRGGRSFARRITLLEGSNHQWRRTSRPCQDTPGGKGRHRRKHHHDQQCYA